MASDRPGEASAGSRVARPKNGFAPKTCVSCGRDFEWRKKWARDWDDVEYCSERCKKNSKSAR